VSIDDNVFTTNYVAFGSSPL